MLWRSSKFSSLLLASLALTGISCARAATAAARSPLPPVAPSGIRLTPTAAAGASFAHLNPHLQNAPGYIAGQAVTTATSPDGRTLLILTSGYNQLLDSAGRVIPAESNEYIFVYDISRGRPERQQALPLPNTYMGMAFAPDG